MNRRVAFQILGGVLIVAGMVHVGTLIPRVVSLAESAPVATIWIVGPYALSAVTALLACLLGAFLLWKAPDRPAARALTLFLAFLAIFWGSLFRFVELTRDADSISVGLTYGGGWASQTALAAYLLAAMSFLRFTALFPQPLTAERLGPVRPKWLQRLRVATFKPAIVWTTAIGLYVLIRSIPNLMALRLGEPPFHEGDIALVVRTNLIAAGLGYLVVPLLAAGLGAWNLRTSYRLADPVERKRMTWVTLGFTAAGWLILIALAVILLVGTLDVPEGAAIAIPVLFLMAPLLVVTGSAVGILYGGAIDPGLALQRSTVYGILAACAVVAFAALENGLSALVEQTLGLPGFLGSMVAGGLVAAVLIPIRRPLKRIVASRLGARRSVDEAEAAT